MRANTYVIISVLLLRLPNSPICLFLEIIPPHLFHRDWSGCFRETKPTGEYRRRKKREREREVYYKDRLTCVWRLTKP